MYGYLLLTDVNECAEGVHKCDPHADCLDTDGHYQCVCKFGYSGNGRTCKISKGTF